MSLHKIQLIDQQRFPKVVDLPVGKKEASWIFCLAIHVLEKLVQFLTITARCSLQSSKQTFSSVGGQTYLLMVCIILHYVKLELLAKENLAGRKRLPGFRQVDVVVLNKESFFVNIV